MGTVAGLVLAAGRGRRMGRPKALLTRPDGVSYLEAACRVLLAAGCERVLAVLGAEADAAARLLERAGLTTPPSPSVETVVNPDWQRGMSTSLRAGLEHVRGDRGVDAVVIHLVDLPDVGADAVARLRGRSGDLRGSVARATYAGAPGHPVLLGRDHWDGVLASAVDDVGARDFLRAHPPELVELGDLATGRDVDTPEDRLNFEAG